MNKTSTPVTFAAAPPPIAAGPAPGLRLIAPARLHLGFLDLSGALGRRFGSLGATLDAPTLALHITDSKELSATGPDAARARAAVERIAARFGLSPNVALTVERALPAHAGLGSGTQLALAAAAAFAALRRAELEPARLAEALARGARSGIGLGAFTQGGVLLDGGKKSGSDAPPPILARHPFPEHWRFVLAFDETSQGLSGGDEVKAMASLPPFPEELAGHLCRLAVMKALPALVEADCASFGAAIGEIQRRLGDHYAGAQGGRYTSPRVAAAMDLALAHGATGVGQSSWGPTGFAILPSPDAAAALVDRLEQRFAGEAGLRFASVRGRNHGAVIEELGP